MPVRYELRHDQVIAHPFPSYPSCAQRIRFTGVREMPLSLAALASGWTS